MTTMTIPPVETRGSTVAATAPAEPITLRRALGIWVMLASVVMFLGPGVPLWLHTGSIWDGIGLGAFCAAWGGPGFGVMLGLSVWSVEHGH